MRGLWKNLFFAVMMVFIFSRTGFAMPEIMPLEKVQSGMNGVAYTVVNNSGNIENFNVNIVGLIDNGKGSSKAIMAEASGAVVEKTGGILQGMSGSPVYVDGKLIGAVAAGFRGMNPYTFLITPIESMLQIWDFPDNKNKNVYLQPVIENVDEEKADEDKTATDEVVEENTDEENADEDNATEDEAVEEKSEIFFSGFDNNGLNFLKDKMQPFGFKNFYAASNSGESDQIKYNAELRPGDAVGVTVVCGDFLVGATGTVTVTDSDKILAFGHPFTHAGNVNFFMTDSSVIGTVSGLEGGMKVAGVGSIIGRINQDREAGIGGIIGRFPATVPITVTVNDTTLDRSESYSAIIAYNENLIPQLGASIAYTALSKTSDTLAESTVSVDFGIKTNVVADGNFSRKNMFYSPADVGQVAVMELLQALNIVCSNSTEESNIFGIDVNMTMDGERKTASLVSAVPNKSKVKPGETVDLTVTLQPYRKPTEKVVVPYTVPLIRPEGPMTLDIHGGALVPIVPTAASGLILPSRETPEKLYKDKIKNFLEANRNNQIIVEPGASTVIKTEKQLRNEIARAKKIQKRIKSLGIKIPDKLPNNKVDTGYIIDNVIQVTINVDKL